MATSQTFTVLSQLPVKRVLPSREKATQKTVEVCPFSVARSFFVARSQILTSPVPSGSLYRPATEASSLPSGEKATPHSRCVCPWSVVSSLPVASSYNRTVLSMQAVASTVLSSEKTSENVDGIGPWNTAAFRRVVRSHMRMVLSSPPLTRVLPSGEGTANQTWPTWPGNVVRAATACWSGMAWFQYVSCGRT